MKKIGVVHIDTVDVFTVSNRGYAVFKALYGCPILLWRKSGVENFLNKMGIKYKKKTTKTKFSEEKAPPMMVFDEGIFPVTVVRLICGWVGG